MRVQGFSGEEIDEALKRSEEEKLVKPEMRPAQTDTSVDINPDDNEFIDEFADQLTAEEKTAMRIKWGRGYRTDEWVRLETLYNDMMKSYDIQGAGMRDTLIMICKASVKANQFIDAGDVDSFQKMTKVYNELMKSAKLKKWAMKNFSAS